MDKYLIGQETCRTCGSTMLVVSRADAMDRKSRVKFDTCRACGAKASRVEAWFPLEYWPEVDALTRFDWERMKLNLPGIAGDCWQ